MKSGAAALVLILVIGGLPWRDELRVSNAGGIHAYAGIIVGDWKSDRVRFAFEADVATAALPLDWKEQFATAGAVEVARSATVSWQPGMPSILRSVEFPGLGVAIALLVGALLGQTTRWWRLLAAVQCPTDWLKALRLTLYGMFFSLVVPGATGGDVVRAVLVAKLHPGRGAAAAASVLTDRLMGLLVLAFLGALVLLLEGDRFTQVRGPVLFVLGSGVFVAAAYANPVLRQAIGFAKLIERLPLSNSLQQIDEALLAYAGRPFELLVAALLSAWNHLCVALAIFMLGRAFGDTTLSLVEYFAVVSVGNIVSTLPIAPGGWGVSEVTYQFLFEIAGADGSIGVTVSITYKLILVLIGLGGGAAMLLPAGKGDALSLRGSSTDPK